MQKKCRNKKNVSLLLCMMLTVAMALGTMGCNEGGSKEASTNPENESGVKAESTDLGESSSSAENNVLGEGQNQFSFIVVDKDGGETHFEIHTDKEVVGDALLELNLIAGDAGPYGLYVKTVNGITADFDVDKTYWAFYVNGEYAQSGVDTTKITPGDSYSFKVAK